MYQHPQAAPLRTASFIPAVVLSDNQTIASGNPTSADGVVIVQGGDYRISAEATDWGGATLTLKALGPKRTTWRGLSNGGVAFTADGDEDAGIPDGATLRGEVTGGTITGLTLVLARMPA